MASKAHWDQSTTFFIVTAKQPADGMILPIRVSIQLCRTTATENNYLSPYWMACKQAIDMKAQRFDPAPQH